MKIIEVNRILNEYNQSGSMTALAAFGGQLAQGKSYDRIAAGVANPYKNEDTRTEYEKRYPNMGRIIAKLKDNALKGDILLSGMALKELVNLLKVYKPKKTENGDWTLPFGDGIRLRKRGKHFFVGYNSQTEERVGAAPTPEETPDAQNPLGKLPTANI